MTPPLLSRREVHALIDLLTKLDRLPEVQPIPAQDYRDVLDARDEMGGAMLIQRLTEATR